MKKLKDATGDETQKCVLEVQVQDEEADIQFFLGDQEITKSDRIDIISPGDGTHKLVYNRLELTDAGEITCVCGPLESKCTLKVNKKETKPKFEVPPKVESPAKEPKVLEVPFTSECTLAFQYFKSNLLYFNNSHVNISSPSHSLIHPLNLCSR